MKEKAQKLFTPLDQSLFDSTNERGSFSGYATIKGLLENNYGSIFSGKNGYTDSTPIFDTTMLLEMGFASDSHAAASNFEYTTAGALGYFTETREDRKGLWLNGEFHSTPDAQQARTKITERLAAKKTYGQSIGFFTDSSFRIYPNEYASKLPLYLAPEYLQQGLKDAEKWDSILIRTKVRVFEDALTPMPAMSPATVTKILSRKPMEKLSKFMGGNAESRAHISALSSLCNSLMYNDFYEAAFNKEKSLEDSTSDLSGAIDEFKDCVMAIHTSIKKLSIENDQDEDDANKLALELRTIFTNPLAGLSNKEQGKALLAEVKSFVTRQISLAELRKKERLSGKVISADKHKFLTEVSEAMGEHCDGIVECKESLDDFLAKHNPSNSDTNTEAAQIQAEFLRMSFSHK